MLKSIIADLVDQWAEKMSSNEAPVNPDTIAAVNAKVRLTTCCCRPN